MPSRIAEVVLRGLFQVRAVMRCSYPRRLRLGRAHRILSQRYIYFCSVAPFPCACTQANIPIPTCLADVAFRGSVQVTGVRYHLQPLRPPTEKRSERNPLRRPVVCRARGFEDHLQARVVVYAYTCFSVCTICVHVCACTCAPPQVAISLLRHLHDGSSSLPLWILASARPPQLPRSHWKTRTPFKAAGPRMVSPPAQALAQEEEEAREGDVVVQAEAERTRQRRRTWKRKRKRKRKKPRTRRSAAGSATPSHKSSAGQGT